MGEVINMVSLDVITDMISELDNATFKKAEAAWEAFGVILAEERERRDTLILAALDEAKRSKS